MLNDRAVDTGVAIEEFYAAAALGRRSAIDELLARFPASVRIRDPVAIALRAMKAATGGDVPGGVALLRRASTHCDAPTRRYFLDLLIPLLVNTAQTDEAARLLAEMEPSGDDLDAAFDALRALFAARNGEDAASIEHARVALDRARACENPVVIGRVLMRTSAAAFYREDLEEAQERSLEAARWHERLDAYTNAAHSYSVLWVIARDWLGDPDVSRFYARRMTMTANLGGDVTLENRGLIAQLEVAAESGDSRRFGSIRGRLLANPMSEQFLRERFSFSLAEALSAGWTGRFDIARANLKSVAKSTTNLVDRATCEALLAVCALTTWHLDEARSHARRAIGMTAERTQKEALNNARARKIARFVASAVCIILGDTVRGRRALSRKFDPDGQFTALISTEGVDEIRIPALMRGYARFINMACREATLRRPQIGLTEAESEVLALLPDGTSVAIIAQALGKSRKTVEKQLGSIYAKLHATNRMEAMRRARELGILK
jgi:DNA-binding CsgD family transcriptional regulator